MDADVSKPRSSDEALRAIGGLLFTCCQFRARAVEAWLDLPRRHPVAGSSVFDLQIVATMQANGIERIYTFNGDDFGVFPELAVLTP
jgi:predicted nucleic acid-binding protein